MDIESIIPAYSVAYAAVRDVHRIRDSMNLSSPWQSVLSFDELAGETQDILGKVKELLGVDLQMLVDVFGSRMAFVQVYIDLDGPAPPAIIANVGDPENAVEIVRKMGQTLDSHEEYEVRSPAEMYQTIPFASIRRVGEEPSIWYAFLDNLFVIAFEQDTFEAILDVYLGKDPSLLYDPRFNKTRVGIPIDGEVFAYVNMELLWPITWRSWAGEFSLLLQMLGVGEVKSVAWATNLLYSTRDQQAYAYIGDSRELITSLFAEHEPLLSPHIIPAANADIFVAMNLGDPSAAWEKFGQAVRNVMGEENYIQMQSEIAEFEQETALSLKDDILSLLTGEIGFAMPVSGITRLGAGPEQLMEGGLVAFCGVRDREQCASSIEKILSNAGIQLQQTEYSGTTIHHSPEQSSLNSPGYAFIGDLLIFGSVQTLQAIINEEMPLVVSEKFAAINSQLPQHLGLMYYIDMQRIGEMLLGAIPGSQSVDDVIRLQTLGSTGGTLIYDGEGLEVRTVGTPARNWLEAIGILAELFVYTLL